MQRKQHGGAAGTRATGQPREAEDWRRGFAVSCKHMIAAALQGLCPKCGASTLFDGWLKFAAKCRSCGLDFTQFNVGDGPAAFLTLIVGTLVTVGAVSLQLSVEPPIWVHLLIWPPVTLALVVGGLRVGKAALLQSEYRR